MLSAAPMSFAATSSNPSRIHQDLEGGAADSAQPVDGDSRHEHPFPNRTSEMSDRAPRSARTLDFRYRLRALQSCSARNQSSTSRPGSRPRSFEIS